MKPHEQRVIDEKTDLDERLGKLRAFFATDICLGLPFVERELLKRQEQAMTAYSSILGQRIAGFCDADQSPVVGKTFGQAIEALKQGARVARAGWNGKDMFVYLVPAASYPAQTGAAKAFYGEGSMVPYNAYLAIKNVDDTVSTWVPSVNDCLAEDWGVVP